MKKHLLNTLLWLSPVAVCAGEATTKAGELLEVSRNTLFTNPRKSADYALEAYDLVKHSSDSPLIAQTLSAYGYACLLQGDFDSGICVYYDALACCPESEPGLRARILMNMGSLYSSLKDYAKALELINAATSLYESLDDSTGIASAYNTKGVVHIYMNENTIAEKYFKDALQINKSIGNKKGVAANINNLCLYEGNTEEKLALIDEAIRINIELNAIWSLAENHNNKGVQLFYAGKHSEALAALKTARTYAIELNAKELICDNYRYYSWVYSAQKDYALAYASLLGLYENENKLLQERKLIEVERKVANQRYIERKRTAELMEEKLKVKILQRNIYIAVVGLVCVFLVIFLLIRNFRKKKNLEIAETKAKLLSQERIIMDLQLKQKNDELKQRSEELKTTQNELIYFGIFLKSRNELLDKIREMIKDTYRLKGDALAPQLKKISAYILHFKRTEKQTQGFVKDLDDQNERFLKRLEEKHPGLTQGEKNLATFLRIDMSTKEISLLTGISIKSIGMARYRLRKSLNLDPKDSIFEYLRSF